MITEEAMEKAYQLAVGIAHRVANKFRIKCPLTVEELRQAGRIGVWKAIPKYDESKGEFTTYAWTYSKREIYGELRKLFKWNSRKESSEVDAKRSYDQAWHLDNKEEANKILKMIHNEQQMKTILACYFDGMSATEYAVQCGQTREQVNSRIGVIRGKVKRRYRDIN
jgi:RNA polymerase sigma factor (sigma-70 family)